MPKKRPANYRNETPPSSLNRKRVFSTQIVSPLIFLSPTPVEYQKRSPKRPRLLTSQQRNIPPPAQTHTSIPTQHSPRHQLSRKRSVLPTSRRGRKISQMDDQETLQELIHSKQEKLRKIFTSRLLNGKIKLKKYSRAKSILIGSLKMDRKVKQKSIG